MKNTIKNSFQELQRKYYNEIADQYDRHYHNQYSIIYRKRLYDKILKNIKLKKSIILDAMCGGGQNTAYFLSKKSIVHGVDISDEQCVIYARHYPQCKIKRASILDTKLPKNTYDLIVVESLHHLHPSLAEGVNEIVSLLKPGGYLLIWEPYAWSLLDLFRKIWYRLDRKFFLDNEKSISLKQVEKASNDSLVIKRKYFGGNFAFFFVFSSMHFRADPNSISKYAPFLIALEDIINFIQPRFLSAWVLALYRKK